MKNKGKVICVESRQTLFGLSFKKIIEKQQKPVSAQIQNFAYQEQNNEECRL